jgi:hypothetical protein
MTTILIEKVSKMNMLMMTVLGSMRKFCGMLIRHDEKDNKRKQNLPLVI